MASLRYRKGNWYARVRRYDRNHKRHEKEVPLRTASKTEADARFRQVVRVEPEIKNGIILDVYQYFPWLNVKGVSRIVGRVLGNTSKEWLKLRKADGLANTTINRNRDSLNTIIGILGELINLDQIDSKAIDEYKYVMQKKGYSPHGINLNLRTLKTFLKWCINRDYLTKVPHISMVRTPQVAPSYISDKNFDKIMSLEYLNNHYKRVIFFYRETGCRLSEPILGRLDGNWLIIDAGFTKQRREKEIELSDKCVEICIEMKVQFDKWKDRVKKPVTKYFLDHYSKAFKRACNQIGIGNHFHDLRHTFAVRRYLQTHDIYQVCKEMGHASVKTTEIYAQFSLKRLKYDFPSIIIGTDNVQKVGEPVQVGDTNLGDIIAISSS